MAARIAVVFVLWFLALRAFGELVSADGVTYTAITTVLSNPEKYEGKRIGLVGYYSRAFESSGLTLDLEAARISNTHLSLWIDLSEEKASEAEIGNRYRGYVMIIGTFYHRPEGGVGHLGGWPAGIKDVELITPRTLPGMTKGQFAFVILAAILTLVVFTAYRFGVSHANRKPGQD